jgi:hypothetical protein
VIARVVAAFILTRALAIGATHLGAALMTPAKAAQWQWIPDRDNLFPGPPPHPFLAPLVRWDANFYLSLARDGYPPRHPGPNHHLAFFPLYPLLLRALHFDVFWAAFFLSNASALIAALCIARLAGLQAAVLFLCSPGAHFFTYPYSEALFAAALAGCLLLLRSERYLFAGLAGAVASATRSPGVAAALALATQAATVASARLRAAAGALVALGGIGAFMWWCHVAQGDALAFVHLQAFHKRHLSLLGPVRAFLAFDCDPDYYLVSIAALYVAARLVRRTPAWQWVTAAFLVLLPMSTGTLQAMIRYQAANVPLICGVPLLAQGRRFSVVAGACCALMCFEAFLYGKGIGHF